MANSLLTINMITREAVRLWKNTNSFLKMIDTQYDDQFARTGAKIGQSLRIRLPNDYTVRTGPAASVQDTAEQQTTLVLATQKGVDLAFSSADRTMSLDDYSRRILAPAVNNLVGAVAVDVMSGAEAGAANLVANFDGGGNVLTPNASTWLAAGATLANNSAPMDRRAIVTDPMTMARTVGSLSGLFNPAPVISEQYRDAKIREALGFAWFEDQTTIKHTTASYTAGFTVNGAGQTGLTLVTSAITGGLNVGDIITIAGVFGVNRITKQTTGQLRQFVVTANVASGGTSVPIYPAIVPPVGGQQVQYQTVTASPANGATVNVTTLPGSTFIRNIAFSPDAVTMATADLELPRGVHEAAREQFDDVSLRMVTAYDVKSDEFITRLDVLYGYLWVRPEWVVVVPDIV